MVRPAHTCRGPDDLEGWAQLCPDCVGKAGDNGFLRFRLRQALTERGAAAKPRRGGDARAAPAVAVQAADPAHGPRPRSDRSLTPTPRCSPTTRPAPPSTTTGTCAAAATRAARSTTRPGTPSSTPPAAGSTALPIAGEIVELAAGTGWWSPLLARKGELSLYDGNRGAARARARAARRARLRAHLHVRDAWAEPDRAVDAVFTGFWLSHVPRARLAAFLALVRRWLKPGGTFAFIDSLPDPQSSAADHPTPADDLSVRRLDDGREFTVVKVYYEPGELEAALGRPASRRPGHDDRPLLPAPAWPRRGPDAGRLSHPPRLYSAPMSPLAKSTIATVGSGVMAEAMIAGLLRGKLVDPQQVVASHPRAERREHLEREYGIRTVASQRRGGRRAPTSSCSGSSPRCSARSGARSARTCGAASSS